MARFGSLGTQYFDDSGDPLINGYIHFYESGSVDTDKNTYADPSFSILNADPVPLTAAGRQPNIFFDGVAKAILYTSAGVQIESRDPVGDVATFGSFDPWVSTAIYSVGEIVTGSDGMYYKSIIGSNQENDPISSPTAWEDVRLSGIWNTTVSYNEFDLVVGSDGYVYVSAQASNSAHNPVGDDGTWWGTSYEDIVVPAGGPVGITATQTLTNKTFTGYTDTVYALAASEFLEANGAIQTKTISGTTTFTDALTTGQQLMLELTAAGSYTINWPAGTVWVTPNGDLAPVFTALDIVMLTKVGSTLYAFYAGSGV